MANLDDIIALLCPKCGDSAVQTLKDVTSDSLHICGRCGTQTRTLGLKTPDGQTLSELSRSMKFDPS